jgi:hypothetical protein
MVGGCAASHGPAPRAGAIRELAPFAAEMIDNAVPATAAQYADGAQFSQTVQELQNLAEARCMNAHGFSQQIPKVSAASIAAAVAFDQDNTQFPNLAWMARTGLFVPDAGISSVGPRRNKEISQAEMVDERSCQASAARPMGPVGAALNAMSSHWIAIVNQVEASAPVRAAARKFAACVMQHGVPSGSAGSLGAFLAWVTGLETHAASHSALLAIERHWVRVFVACARKLVTVQEGLQNDRRRTFLRDHYQEVLVAEGRVTGAITTLEKLADAPPGLVSK